jgi:hypothetical protein
MLRFAASAAISLVSAPLPFDALVLDALLLADVAVPPPPPHPTSTADANNATAIAR